MMISQRNEVKHYPTYRILLPFLVVISSFLSRVLMGLYKDSDTLWSLGIGRWISQHGSVPTIDVFSWSVSGKPWISMEWLYCYISYKMESFLGHFGIILLILFAYIIFGYITYSICLKINNSSFSIWFFGISTFFFVFISASARAYIFTFLFLAVIIYIVRFKRDSNLKYLLPVLFILWGNVQSSAMLGAVIVLFEGIMEIILKKRKQLLFVSLLSVTATLVNPYTIKMWQYLYTFLFHPQNKMITEWRAPDFNSKLILAIYTMIAFIGIIGSYKAYILYKASKKKFDYDKLMIFIWFWVSFCYSLYTSRGVYYAILFLIPFTVTFIPRLIINRFSLNPTFSILIYLVYLIFAMLLSTKSTFNVFPPEVVPINAINFLEHNPQYTGNIYNDYMYGGIMIYSEIKPFIDARADIYIENGVFEDYLKVSSLVIKPDDVFSKYRIKNIFIIRGSRLDIYLEENTGWKKIYQDSNSVIYSKI